MMKGFALRPPLLKELLRRIEARTCAISVCAKSRRFWEIRRAVSHHRYALCETVWDTKKRRKRKSQRRYL